jgi:hypothetical protein
VMVIILIHSKNMFKCPFAYSTHPLTLIFTVKQSVLSRTPAFDGSLPLVPVEVVLSQYKAPAVWLNVQVGIKL